MSFNTFKLTESNDSLCFISSEEKLRRMADRKAELERKKAKLQALREEKLRRQKEREQQELENSHRVLRGEVDQKVDIDQLLTSVGVAPVSSKLLCLGEGVCKHSCNVNSFQMSYLVSLGASPQQLRIQVPNQLQILASSPLSLH